MCLYPEDLKLKRQALTELGLKFQSGNFTWDSVRTHGILFRCLEVGKHKPTCGRILAHCKDQISRMREVLGVRICIFKIGVSANPVSRFLSYADKGFTCMRVINMSTSVDLTHMLEAALIGEFGKHVGCRNKEGSGGEGALNREELAESHFYVYVVGGRADQPRWVG